MLIEDVACPVSKLADMTLDLVEMFQRFGYKDASCFGHALEGNLHLVFSQVWIFSLILHPSCRVERGTFVALEGLMTAYVDGIVLVMEQESWPNRLRIPGGIMAAADIPSASNVSMRFEGSFKIVGAGLPVSGGGAALQ